MIITNFQKRSLKQILKAHLSASDKVENLREMLNPYHLQNQLKNVYSPRQLVSEYNGKLSQSIKDLAFNPKPLASKHYYKIDKNHHISEIKDSDVKGIAKQVLRLLKHSQQ